MNTIPFSDARSCLTDIVNEVAYAGKHVILTRKGRKIAAIISLEDFKMLESVKKERSMPCAQPVRRKRKIRRMTDRQIGA